MWGLTIYLMALADLFSRRRRKARSDAKCDVCGKKYARAEELESHRRQAHPDEHPKTTTA